MNGENRERSNINLIDQHPTDNVESFWSIDTRIMTVLFTILVVILTSLLIWWCGVQQTEPYFKGPKAVLAAAIAAALGEFFIVPTKLIEVKLLFGSRIVLNKLKLRPQTVVLPNSVGQVTGNIERATFSWAWGPSSEGGLVKTCTLTIQGIQTTVILSKLEEADESSNNAAEEKISGAIYDAASPRVEEKYAGLTEREGGIYAYVERQVEMILDTLMLHINDVQVTIELPKKKQSKQKGMSVQVGTKSFEVVSLERHQQSGVIEQPVTLTAFYCSVLLGGGSDLLNSSSSSPPSSYPLMDPFTYSVDTKRTTSERFSSWLTDLKVVGHSKNDMVVHMDSVQMCALTRLGTLLMAPPSPPDNDEDEESATHHHDESKNADSVIGEDATAYPMTTKETKSSSQKGVADEATGIAIGEGEPSDFSFTFSSMVLILHDDTKVKVPNVSINYRADGTVMDFRAGSFRMDNDDATVSLRGIYVSMVLPMTLRLESIDELFVAGKIRVAKPIPNVQIIEKDSSVMIDLESVEATVLSAEDDGDSKKEAVGSAENAEDQDASEESQGGVSVPFPVKLSLGKLQLKTSTDDSRIQLDGFSVYAAPTVDRPETQVAVQLEKLESDLLQLSGVNFYGILPVNKADEIDKVHFAVESGRVAGGRSAQEWFSKFRTFKLSVPQTVSQHERSSNAWKTPFAKFDKMKLVISYKMAGMVKLKDTKITINPFEGNSSTTSIDIVKYYAEACLNRVPNFIPNAEVLGLNVVDSAAGSWGGVALREVLGPLGGIAAVAAVDGVKSIVHAGREDRQGDRFHLMDIPRGLVHTVERAGDDGAAILGQRRRSEGGKEGLVDVAVGLATDTSKYAFKNRGKLVVAAAGGVGFFFGEVGGPGAAIGISLAAEFVASRLIKTMKNSHAANEVHLRIQAVARGPAAKAENLIGKKPPLSPKDCK
jgi:hypothetical protein